MDESEKLTALKKAYADIILNTAKEAAARVIVSEKKAVRLQRELLYTKEEALRMLLRLKQTCDSKVGEAEMKSLTQQGKIDELEAQLQEAEDIVSDLRGELSEVQDQLEKAKKKQAGHMQDLEVGEAEMKSLTQQGKIDELEAQLQEAEDIVSDLRGELSEVQDQLEKAKKKQAGHMQDLEVDTTKGKMSQHGQCFPGRITSQLYLQADVVANNDKKSNLYETYEGSKCYITSDSLKDHNYVHNSDFASLVMRSKEPELYRNGCTQRIRAFERNLFDEKLSLSGLVDGAKHATFIGGNGEGKGMSITPTPKFDDMHEVEKNLVEVKVRLADESYRREKEQLDIEEVPAVMSFCRKRKRTARNRSKVPSSTHLPHQFMEARQVSGLSCCTTSPNLIDNNGFTGNAAKKCEDKTMEVTVSVSTSKSPSDTTEMSSQSACDMVTESDVQLIRPWSVQKETNNDKTLTEKSELTRHECLSAENLEVLPCKTDVQKDESDLKASHPVDLVASQPVSNKFLKYTFHRKRKKETLSKPERNSQTGTLEGKTRETKIGSLQPQQSNVMPASSRDSRQLALVAHQLISLSEKKR